MAIIARIIFSGIHIFSSIVHLSFPGRPCPHAKIIKEGIKVNKPTKTYDESFGNTLNLLLIQSAISTASQTAAMYIPIIGAIRRFIISSIKVVLWFMLGILHVFVILLNHYIW